MNKLAIFFGYPSLVYDTTVNGAVSVFKEYDLLILGKDLEKNSHSDHNNTEQIINHVDMSSTEVYGYIDTTYSSSQMQVSVNRWDNMNVAGIYINQFGYDFGTTREKQNEFVDYIHGKGLKVFVNSWVVDDALGNQVVNPNNINGLSHKLLTTDWYLAESFGIKNNEYDNGWITKGQNILNNYFNDIQFAACASMNSDGTATDLTYSQNKADYSYYIAVMHGFQAWCFGEDLYSAVSSSLPFRQRKDIIDFDYFKTNIFNNGDVYERRTNVGIHIDANTHTVLHKLD
jgi:hypothetical protein